MAAARPASRGIPPAVILPTRLAFEGTTFPGQNAGFSAARHDPWHLVGDPADPSFAASVLNLPAEVGLDRSEERSKLLRIVETQQRAFDRSASVDDFDRFHRQAIDLLVSGRCRRAFDLSREDPRLRDRYGGTLMGQGLLLGLRLVEAGVPLVQVNLGDSNVWDTHENNFGRLKSILLPPFDQAVSALIDDLEGRGLWDEVLVIVTGEFGRTPRIGQPIKGGLGQSPMDAITGRECSACSPLARVSPAATSSAPAIAWPRFLVPRPIHPPISLLTCSVPWLSIRRPSSLIRSAAPTR